MFITLTCEYNFRARHTTHMNDAVHDHPFTLKIECVALDRGQNYVQTDHEIARPVLALIGRLKDADTINTVIGQAEGSFENTARWFFNNLKQDIPTLRSVEVKIMDANIAAKKQIPTIWALARQLRVL